MKKFSVLIAITVSIAFLYSFTSVSLPDPWVVPDKYLKMKNPVKADAASIKAGKLLYEKHCQSCHGKTGKGDGSKAAQLDTEPGDFSAKAFKTQPDGALFYKTQTGRDDMPSFKNKIPDEVDIWHTVNYMRTFCP
jgi:mono/diheme cytochrome c family protein